MEKYIKIYHKRNAQLGCLCAFIAFVPLFIVSLFYDVISEDTLVSFVPFALAAICVAVASLYTIRFKKLIKQQEEIYLIQFQDDNVEHLETTLYLSDNWLIWAGSCAFYKNHIKSISSVRRFGRAGSSNQVTIKTVDDKKYTVWCLSASNVKKLKQWGKS
jgi:predicted ferric reductase